MFIYSLLFLLIGMLLILSSRVTTKFFFVLSFLLLLALSGFRFDVGTDYMMYNHRFTLILTNSQPFNYAILNMYLIRGFQALGLTNQAIFLCYSGIILFGIYYFIEKLSYAKEISALLFLSIGIFYFSTMNEIREWVAVSLSLISVVHLVKKKYIKAIFFTIIGILFHFSAIIFLFILPFLAKRYTKYNIGLMLIGIFSIATLIPIVLAYTPYNMYLTTLRFADHSSQLFVALYCVVLIFFLIYFKYFNHKYNMDRGLIILLNMNILSILILLIGYELNIDFLSVMRVNMYFEMQLIILIPLFLVNLNNSKFKQLVFISIILFCTSYFFYLVAFKGEMYKLVPYNARFELIA